MIGILHNHTMEVARWVADRIPGCSRGWNNCYAIGVVRDTDLIGGMVYHDWSPESGVVEVSAAADSPKWLSKNRLRELFGYPFDALECRMIAMRVHPDNDKMRDIAKRLGCKEYVIDDLRADGVPEVLYTLTKAAWSNFIGGENRQTPIAHAA